MGEWPLRYHVLYKKLMLLHNLVKGKDRLAKRVIKDQEKYGYEDTWHGETSKGAKEVKVDIRRIEEKSKSEWKKQIKIRIKEKVGNIAREKIKDQTKLRFLNQHDEKSYITKLKAEDVQTVIRVIHTKHGKGSKKYG